MYSDKSIIKIIIIIIIITSAKRAGHKSTGKNEDP